MIYHTKNKIMKELNLHKLWEVCNILSEKEAELSESNTYVRLLGHRSNFSAYSFEQFLSFYSFTIEDDYVVVFNNDGVPYESFSNDDYSYIPIPILGFGEKELENYIEQTIKMQLEEQETQKIAEKEEIKRKIERLTKQLEEY